LAADRSNELSREHAGEDYIAYLRRTEVLGRTEKRRWENSTDKFRALKVTVDKMINHEVFSAGAGLHDFANGFKPCHVRSDLTREQVSERLKDIFSYDPRPVKNPPGRMSHFEPCAIRNGGFCDKWDMLASARNLTVGIYAAARFWKDQFPVLLEFEVGQDASKMSQYVFVGKLVGEGQLAMVTRTIKHAAADGDDGSLTLDLDLVGDDSKPTSIPITSHKFFESFLGSFETTHHVDQLSVESVRMNRWGFVEKTCSTEFCVIPIGVLSEHTLSCVTRAATRGKDGGDREELPFGMTAKLKSSGSYPLKAHKLEKALDGGGGGDTDSSANDSRRSWPSDDDDDCESDPSPEEKIDEAVVEPAPEAWNCVGIKNWSWAPSSQAACIVCGNKILKHEFRMDYRLKESTNLGDQKRFHGTCAAGIPAATRARDIRLVRGFIVDPALGPDATLKLQEVLDLLLA
jgi:hypothetical protein